MFCSILSVSKTSLQREKAKPVLGKHYFGEDWDLKQIIMGYHMKRGIPSEEIEKGLNLYIDLSLICIARINFVHLQNGINGLFSWISSEA